MWCRYHLTLTPQRAVAWENTRSGGVGHTAPSWRHPEMFQVRRWRRQSFLHWYLHFCNTWLVSEMDSSDDDTVRRDSSGVARLAWEEGAMKQLCDDLRQFAIEVHQVGFSLSGGVGERECLDLSERMFAAVAQAEARMAAKSTPLFYG